MHKNVISHFKKENVSTRRIAVYVRMCSSIQSIFTQKKCRWLLQKEF